MEAILEDFYHWMIEQFKKDMESIKANKGNEIYDQLYKIYEEYYHEIVDLNPLKAIDHKHLLQLLNEDSKNRLIKIIASMKEEHKLLDKIKEKDENFYVYLLDWYDINLIDLAMFIENLYEKQEEE